jgi:peptidoglycan hydrolase-like protein with peptidoglycan-binding domain
LPTPTSNATRPPRWASARTRQRHEALKELGYYAGDVATAWGSASTEALRAAQTALGVGVDGKWGPETEDAIQRALAEKQGCTGDECSAADTGDEASGGSTDAVASLGRLGWLVIGGMTVAGVAVGVALTMRSRA